MSRCHLAAAAILCATVLLAGARPARADDAVKEAQKHFREGQKHFNLGEFEDALKEFKESYRLKDSPTLLFNIGQCQWKLGDLRSAIHSYRAYLRMGTDVPNRAEVQARIKDLDARLQAEEAKAAASAGATVQPSTPAEASAPGALAPSATPVAAPAALPLAAPLPKATDEPRISTEAAAADERRPVYKKWWFWTAIAVGVAGGIVAALALRPSSPSAPDCPSGVSCLSP